MGRRESRKKEGTREKKTGEKEGETLYTKYKHVKSYFLVVLKKQGFMRPTVRRTDDGKGVNTLPGILNPTTLNWVFPT